MLVSKHGISDTFYRCHLTEDVGAFSYVLYPTPSDPATMLCIDLVLPMEWVNSPGMFYSTSETVTCIVITSFTSADNPGKTYAPTNRLYNTSPEATSGPSRLQYVYIYMYVSIWMI